MATETEAKVEHWTRFALVLGFNELAKAAKTLGERAFFRLARDAAEAEYLKAGGLLEKHPQDGDGVILELEETMPRIAFQARDIEMDIEMMRAAVAAHDAAGKKPSCSTG